MTTAEQIPEAQKVWKISNGRMGGKWYVWNTENNVGLYLATRAACVAFIENQITEVK